MKFVLPIILSSFLLSSCGNTLYVSNAVNMPLLGQKGDFNINWARRFVAPSNLDFQSSFAPLDHFVLALNGVAMHGKMDVGVPSEFTGRFIEAGAGVFEAFSDDTNEKPFRVELLGGYGLGKSSNIREDELVSDGQYQRKFLQPAIGLRTEFVDVGLGLRISEINFSHYNKYTDGKITEQGTYDFATLEPALSIAVGYRGFKLAGQLGGLSAVSRQNDFENALGDDDWLKLKIYASFSFGNWREATPPPPAFVPAKPDTSLSEVQPITIQVYHNKCWACFRHKGSAKDDSIDLYFNGVSKKNHIMLSRSFLCFELGVLSGQDNILEIHRSYGRKPKQPIEILVRDGKVERRFFLNIEAGQAKVIRLKL